LGWLSRLQGMSFGAVKWLLMLVLSLLDTVLGL
jgi:hypothetical protein